MARIPLPNEDVTPVFGIRDTSGYAPELAARRAGYAQGLVDLQAVDPVTLELCRLRNARHQDCQL